MNAAESNPQAHSFETLKTARYYTLGGEAGVQTIWLALHGYGMLPRYWVRKLVPLADEHTLVVVPEGLSRFYLDEQHTRVGASWMTREDRLTDVQDYVRYLDALVTHLYTTHDPGTRIPLQVLGFSQGAATAWRWVALGSHMPRQLVIWAGTVPWSECPLPPPHPRLRLVCGTRDPYFPAATWQQHANALREAGYSYEALSFEGAHSMDPQILAEIRSAKD
ncbi:MAG: phospholipase [Bacteroidetes bacterium]|nr:phospholipase [Bacteroidota bacterium]